MLRIWRRVSNATRSCPIIDALESEPNGNRAASGKTKTRREVMARRALQRSLGSLLVKSRCREFDVLLWNWPLVQSVCSVAASSSLASTSRALPLAVALAVRVDRDGVGGRLIQIPVPILHSW